uniref:CHK kinase-like domain-containing protein n=1 Tax=Plectus sambesii TaxID=2011161 RepID=A0A914XJW8_9BILA
MEYFGSSLNRLRAFIENSNNQPYSAISIYGDMDVPLVLTHGDLYKFNIMWKKTGKDDETSDELIAFVDYQNAHVGSIGEDLMHLFCTSVSAQTRRAHFDKLIDHYYASLTAKLRTTPPFTTAQMKTAFWRFFPFALVMLLPIWQGFSAEKCFHLIGKKNPELKRRMMLEIVKCAVEDWYKHVDETEAD